MRTAATVLALLLFLAPLAVAQSGQSGQPGQPGQPSPSGEPRPDDGAPADCSRAPDPQRCEAAQRFCREHPDAQGCRKPDSSASNSTTGDRPDPDRPGSERPDKPEAFCSDANRSAEKERCEDAVDDIEDDAGARREHIRFTVDAANSTLADYTVEGLLVLDRIVLGLDDGNLSIDRQGSTLRVRDGDSELRLHDEPNGLVRFKGDGNVTLDFPATARIDATDHGARIGYGSGRDGHLLADNATWLDDGTVRLNGFFAFHVPPSAAVEKDERPEVKEVEERKQEAIERGKFGAEIHLKPRDPAAAVAAGNDSVEILAYDDLEVQVDLPADEAVPDAPVRVVVSSELDEGRTIVLNLDEDLLESTDPADLLLRYFDLHNQTDGSVVETEVVFQAAASLDDVLDPADDGGQPEYWVVEDANGVQVLISVPHWSSHAITVASLATALPAPSVVIGIVAGTVASVGMAALLLWPRRRDDE